MLARPGDWLSWRFFFCWILHYLQTIAGILPQIRPRSLPSSPLQFIFRLPSCNSALFIVRHADNLLKYSVGRNKTYKFKIISLRVSSVCLKFSPSRLNQSLEVKHENGLHCLAFIFSSRLSFAVT
jgi:hypothetical protein